MIRARHTIMLMSSASKQSAFVPEMLDDASYGVVRSAGQSNRLHTLARIQDYKINRVAGRLGWTLTENTRHDELLSSSFYPVGRVMRKLI